MRVQNYYKKLLNAIADFKPLDILDKIAFLIFVKITLAK